MKSHSNSKKQNNFKNRIRTMLWIGIGAMMFSACGMQTAEDETSSGTSMETVSESETHFSIHVEDDTEYTGAVKDEDEAESKSSGDDSVSEYDAVAEWMDMLTLEEKVGQLLIVRPDALDPSQTLNEISDSKTDGVTEVTSDMVEMLQKYPVGGICQFAKNIESPDQLREFNAALQEMSEIPMFITVDEEGGLVARLANHKAFDLPTYKNAATVGASGDENDAKDMGRTIGNYLAEYGFNMDFAPVADVNTNPENPIIGTRAFSSDAETAAKMVRAAAEGFRESGILPTLKHFPGHGDTAEDSHTSLAVTEKTLEELQACEFLPFESDSGMHAVMVGHIAAPNVTGNDLPATLSAEMIQLIPNREDTLIITDSLEMKAISDVYSSGEAAVRALEAGCDIILMPIDLPEAYETILEAVQDGRISEERIDESVWKVLAYKRRFCE